MKLICIIRMANKRTSKQSMLLKRLIDSNGCWIWTGAKYKSGYGAVSYLNTSCKTHRLSMHFWKGFDLSSNNPVCHMCDVPACFNPDHLYVGTYKQNTFDAIDRGRFCVGELHHKAKLSNNQVIDIRKMYQKGHSVADIADKFSVSRKLIRRVITRETWKHI